MASTVSDVMTPEPTSVEAAQTVRDAADLMRAGDIGALVVREEGRFVGLVTDRDLVVRVLATGGSPDDPVRQACSATVVTVAPGDTIEHAARLMAEHAVRRIPVLEGEDIVGIVSIGDLAIERDPDSALGEISAEQPNN